MRVAGIGLIAAVFVGPVAANADTGSSGGGLLNSLTSSVGGLFGAGSGANSVTPAASSSTGTGSDGYGSGGYGSGGSGYGSGYGGTGTAGSTRSAGSASGTSSRGSGGATATDTGSTTANSVGNSGAGTGNQVSGTVQAPITIDCNAVGVLGLGYADCPTGAPSGYGTPPSGSSPSTGTSTTTTTRKGPGSTVAATTAAAPAANSLPLTGAPSESIGLAGGALLLVGGGLLWVSRPRRRARHAQ
jgi:LPXTG-motif cell wall-anchored protein